MKRNFLLLSILISCQFLMAQDSADLSKVDTVIRNLNLKVTVVTKTGSNAKGWLQKVSDSSILLSTSSVRFNSIPVQTPHSEIGVANIDVIKMRKKGQVGRGFMWGALAGAGI